MREVLRAITISVPAVVAARPVQAELGVRVVVLPRAISVVARAAGPMVEVLRVLRLQAQRLLTPARQGAILSRPATRLERPVEVEVRSTLRVLTELMVRVVEEVEDLLQPPQPEKVVTADQVRNLIQATVLVVAEVAVVAIPLQAREVLEGPVVCTEVAEVVRRLPIRVLGARVCWRSSITP